MTLLKYAKTLSLVICFLGPLQQAWVAFRLGNDLSPVADAYSESNAVRAGASYAERGFSQGAGLPFVDYSDRFIGKGALEGTPPPRSERGLSPYTHYPPGPDLIAGLGTWALSPPPISLLRIFPILVGLFSLLAVRALIRRSFDDPTALFGVAVVTFLPGFQNMMHGIHYQGYAMSLLAVQFALGLAFLRSTLRSPAALALHFLLGLTQGWLSFDYCFLVTFTPAAAAAFVLLSDRPDQKSREVLRDSFAACFVSGLGFTVAHALHLLQVRLYFGNWPTVFADFKTAAAERSSVVVERGAVLWKYLSNRTEGGEGFFASVVTFAVLLALYFLFFRRDWRLARRTLILWGITLVISSLWILVMPNHGWNHQHFLPKHYMISYLFPLVFLFWHRRRT